MDRQKVLGADFFLKNLFDKYAGGFFSEGLDIRWKHALGGESLCLLKKSG